MKKCSWCNTLLDGIGKTLGCEHCDDEFCSVKCQQKHIAQVYCIRAGARDDRGWLTGAYGMKYFFEAKVYDKPSVFGINEGRVSKLLIWDSSLAAKTVYNYDRGNDINHISPEILTRIVDFCEQQGAEQEAA